jgi:hypothetical protein
MTRYGPYESNYGHLFFIDIYEDGTRKSIWVHKEVLEKKLGRPLADNEVSHHIDGDKKNNSPNNLEVMPKGKHNSLHIPEADLFFFTCPICGTPAVKRMNLVKHNRKQGSAGPFCSRKCAGKHNTNVQYGK